MHFMALGGIAPARPRPRARGFIHFRRSHEDTWRGNKAKRTITLAAVVRWRHTAPPKATVWALVVARSGLAASWCVVLVAASPRPPPIEVRAISERS